LTVTSDQMWSIIARQSSYLHGLSLIIELKHGPWTIKRLQMRLLHLARSLSCGFTMSQLSMQMIGALFNGSTRGKQLYHVQKGRVPRLVTDFVSADYGQLRSVDGSKSTCVLFKAGKNQEGYFTNSDIVEYATATMNILKQDYSDEVHATTHQKQEEEALSATKIPESSKEWGIVTNELDEDCNKVHSSDGKVLKMTVHMGDTKFADGTPQALYYPRQL
jgi:hypothetical protein